MDKPRAYGHGHFFNDCGIQTGYVSITPTANTPSFVHVDFKNEYAELPLVFATPVTTVPGSTVRAVSVANISVKGCDVYVYRTNASQTVVEWMAVGKLK